MDTRQASHLFGTLAAKTRLDIFRLLAQHAPDGLVAGKISRLLGIPASNLSFHLKALMHSGLVAMEKEGRFLRYRANIPLMLEITGYLCAECCSADPEQCRRYRLKSGGAAHFFPTRAGNETG